MSPSEEVLACIAEIDEVTPADAAKREPFDDLVNKLLQRPVSVGVRVLVEPAPDTDEVWRAGKVQAVSPHAVTVPLDGVAQAIAAHTQTVQLAPPPLPAQFKADTCVRVAYGAQWYFGKVTTIHAGRELVTVSFDNGDEETVPSFDVFEAETADPIVDLEYLM
jgi:hypothetical protein